MKHKNLKEALCKLDAEYLASLPEAPASELYYSPEYEKKINRLRNKKNMRASITRKVLVGHTVAFLLGIGMTVGIIRPLVGNVRAESNEIWQYDEVDFSDASITVRSPDSAALLGYTKGTYEYDFASALSSLSYYTAITEKYIRFSHYSYHEDSLVGGFLQYVPKEEICQPYDDILLHAFRLLDACGYAPAELPAEAFADYCEALPYHGDQDYITSFLGLSFSGIHDRLTECADALIALKAKYPSSDTSNDIISLANALIDACAVVSERQAEHQKQWIAYYATVEPSLSVTEEFIPSLDAVKITISGSGRYTAQSLPARYIENTESAKQPHETLTLYLPTSSYFGFGNIESTIHIEKHNRKGKQFYVDYTLSLDPAQYYSDDPITMNNGVLDALLRGYFGESYSERDLLLVEAIRIQYHEYSDPLAPSNGPILYVDIWNGMRFVTLSCALDLSNAASEAAFKEALAEDLKHFHALDHCTRNGEAAERLVPLALVKDLNPYFVNKRMAELDGFRIEYYE